MKTRWYFQNWRIFCYLQKLFGVNWHSRSRQIPYYSHHIAEKSLLRIQESSILVAFALMGKGGHVNRK
jgi:hypothetical protein